MTVRPSTHHQQGDTVMPRMICKCPVGLCGCQQHTVRPYTDADVELVARTLWAEYRADGPPTLICYEDARAVLDALAAAGRLLPETTQESTEWGVWWHATDPDGIVMADYQHSSRQQAESIAKERIGQYGITGYTLVSCKHRRFADGSSWAGGWDRGETVMPAEARS